MGVYCGIGCRLGDRSCGTINIYRVLEVGELRRRFEYRRRSIVAWKLGEQSLDLKY